MVAERATRRAESGEAEPRRARLQGLASYLADSGSAEFDRLIYERVRLGIMSALSVSPTMSFTELRDLLGTSDGNLSVHARKLEDAGYVNCRKRFEGRLPRTEYRLTTKGAKALEKYLAHMEALIHATREG